MAYSSYAAAMAAACDGRGMILAPLPFANEEIAVGRLAMVSDQLIEPDSGYAPVMRHASSSSPRGRAIYRKISRIVSTSITQ